MDVIEMIIAELQDPDAVKNPVLATVPAVTAVLPTSYLRALLLAAAAKARGEDLHAEKAVRGLHFPESYLTKQWRGSPSLFSSRLRKPGENPPCRLVRITEGGLLVVDEECARRVAAWWWNLHWERRAKSRDGNQNGG